MIGTQFFVTERVRLHGARMGEGPLVVYLHGITANWAVWEPILWAMRGVSTGVSVSQRGHGLSDKPVSGYTGADFAADVIALVESLEMGPAVVAGHSLGARNAVLAGHRRPDLVRAVLSIDFAPNTGRDALEVLARRVEGGNREFADMDEVRAYLSDRYQLMPADAVERRARHGYVETDEGTLRPLADPEAMRQTAAGLFEPYPVAYRELSVPMIALRGAASTLVSQEAFDDAARLRPDIEHIVIEGADHYIPEELPDVVCASITRLLG